MPLNITLTIPLILKGLYESLGLFNKCNRSYDSRVQSQWASSVDVPRNPQLVVRDTAAAKNSADRKKTKDDIDTINIPFQKRIIHITDQLEGNYETNGDSLRAFTADVVRAFERDFNNLCANEALANAVAVGGAAVKPWAANELQYADLNKINQYFDGLEVPKEERVVIIDNDVADQFKNIDVVKSAVAFNKDLLEKGVAVIDNVTYMISANLNKVNGKPALVGLWTKALAFIIKKHMDRKEVWDTEETVTHVDFIGYVAKKVTYTEGSMALVRP